MSQGKRHGGLALGGILNRNRAVLDKWLWRYPLERNSVWATVIRSKFEHVSNGWDAVHLPPSSHLSPWKRYFPNFPVSFLSLNSRWVVVIGSASGQILGHPRNPFHLFSLASLTFPLYKRALSLLSFLRLQIRTSIFVGILGTRKLWS